MPLQPSPYRRGRVDIGAWRRRVSARLTSRFGLRLHMSLVVALVFAVAFLTTRLLLALHVHAMGLRYLAASLTGYGAFFGLVRVWLWYVTREAEADLNPGASPDDVATALDPEAPLRDDPEPESAVARGGDGSAIGNLGIIPDVALSSGSSGGSSGGGGGGLDVDGEGLVVVLVIAVLALVAVVLFGAAGYVVYQAPALLGEAAFEAVLASVLARSSRRVTTADWTGSVLAATWKPAALMATVATLGGMAAQGLCPGPSTLGGVVKQCVVERDER